MSAGSIAGIIADICAGIRVDIYAGIVAGILAETLPRLFTQNDCRVHCRASNPQPRFFFACFFAGIPAAIEVSYYSVSVRSCKSLFCTIRPFSCARAQFRGVVIVSGLCIKLITYQYLL